MLWRGYKDDDDDDCGDGNDDVIAAAAAAADDDDDDDVHIDSNGQRQRNGSDAPYTTKRFSRE